MTGQRHVAAYLARHAAPESVAAAEALPRAYACAVVVPARDEAADGALPRRLAPAVTGRDALAIVVVNADPASSPKVRATNVALWDSLAARGRVEALTPTMHWVRDGDPDWLLIDRTRDGRRLAPGQGVGTARRLGCDLALALWQRGRLARPWIDTTDADATLPADYFDDLPSDLVAVHRPFVHRPGGDAALDEATAVYDMTLRYYVAGLATARSPWSMHTVGSCISVTTSAYAAVRGIPPRAAGEDFYLLGKVAKLGRVGAGTGAPIELATRASDRVPFGTGPAATALAETIAHGRTPTVYDPASFVDLRRVLGALVSWCAAPETMTPTASVLAATGPRPHLQDALAALRVDTRLSAAMRGARTPAARRRRLHEWFDAFRTLKFIHALRAAGHAEQPWPDAVASLTDGPPSSVPHAVQALDAVASSLPTAGYGGAAWRHWEQGSLADQ